MNIEKFMNVKTIVKRLRNGETLKANSEVDGYKITQENLDKGLLVLEAEKYVNDFREKNGNKGFICERLRDGFIGELVHCSNGSSYIQSVRGKPFGTVVAIKNGDTVAIGTSYLDAEDMDSGYPIIGEYLALQRAEFNAKEGKEIDPRAVKSKASRQVKHFLKRSKAFFMPEKYSYSRGTEPVQYENYDEIHARRAMILGK